MKFLEMLDLTVPLIKLSIISNRKLYCLFHFVIINKMSFFSGLSFVAVSAVFIFSAILKRCLQCSTISVNNVAHIAVLPPIHDNISTYVVYVCFLLFLFTVKMMEKYRESYERWFVYMNYVSLEYILVNDFIIPSHFDNG